VSGVYLVGKVDTDCLGNGIVRDSNSGGNNNFGQTEMRRETLSRNDQQDLAEKTYNIKQRRKQNPVTRKTQERLRAMHQDEVRSGRRSPPAPMLFGSCLRNCKNRDMDCEDCYHFSKFEAI
jgi:hypothetical protein